MGINLHAEKLVPAQVTFVHLVDVGVTKPDETGWAVVLDGEVEIDDSWLVCGYGLRLAIQSTGRCSLKEAHLFIPSVALS